MIDVTDLERRLDLLRVAIRAARARDWLLQFAPVDNERDCRIEVYQTHGSACRGSEEGHEYLKWAAEGLQVEIGRRALSLAEADIQAATKETP